MPKLHEILNGLLLVLISSALATICTLYLVNRKFGDMGPRVLVVDTAAMVRLSNNPATYNETKAKLNADLDALAKQGFIILDGAMVLRYPETAVIDPLAGEAP